MKQTITITGELLAPLTVGVSARIRNQNEMRITTAVEGILEQTDTRIRFETRNTVYTLHLPKEAAQHIDTLS